MFISTPTLIQKIMSEWNNKFVLEQEGDKPKKKIYF